MSEPETLGQLDFIAICQRLYDAQAAAETPGARNAADEAFGHFLRMAEAGRLQEWHAAHGDGEC